MSSDAIDDQEEPDEEMCDDCPRSWRCQARKQYSP